MAIRLTLLGGLRAFRDDAELSDLPAQPHRAALLIYLALERRVARDSLLTVFWPESDEENARHALRQNLYRLRHALGGAWLESHAQELVCRVQTDVATFEAALEHGDPERAARLYAGPFLNGVHLVDLKPWETWVDARRAGLARSFRRACRDWLATCRAGGDPKGAVEAALHWVAADPLDDEAQHRLIEALADAGEPAEALRQFESYTRLLEPEGLRPLDDTLALVERLRRADVRTLPPAAVRAAPAAVRAAARRPGWLAIAAGVTAIGLGAAGLWLRPAMPATPRDDVILILPLQASSTGELSFLTDGIVDLLARNVEGVAGLTPVDPHTAIRIAQDAGRDGPIDARRGSQLAAQVGARFFLLGTATEHEGRVALSARLYDAGSPDLPATSASVTGDTGEVFRLVDQLTSDLMVSRFGAASAQLARRAARTTPSAEAFQHFLRGEQALRAARYDSAVAHFQHAVGADTAFALAHYRLAVAAVQNHSPRVAFDAIQRALQHADGLGTRDSRLSHAFAAMHAGRADEAEAAYRAIVEEHPDDLEARVQLGALLALYNPLRGRPVSEALAHLGLVGAVDPAYLCPVCTMVNIALQDRDVDAADSLMGVRYGTDPIVVYRAAAAAARGDSVQLERWLARFDRPGFWQASWLAAFFGDFDAAERMLVDPRPVQELPENLRILTRLSLADLHVARTRWTAARAELQQAERIAPRRAMLRRAYHVTLPFTDPPRDEIEAIRDALEAWRIEPGHGAGEPLPLQSFLPSIRSYLLGLAHVRLDDRAAAEAEAGRLRVLTAGDRSLERDLALVIRADMAFRDDAPERALAYLDSMRTGVPFEVLDAVAAGPLRSELADVLTLDHARFLRVQALLRLGRPAQALRWAENGFFRIGGNPLYTPALHLAKAQAYGSIGRGDRARTLHAEYRRMVESEGN